MRFQCSHCGSIVAIDDSECGSPVGCGKCGGVTTVPETRFSPGAVINDFIIKQTIGHGGMGQVYLAHQQSLDRPVALKVLMDEFSRNSEFIVDFVKEARAAARLNHPNIVQSYAVGEEDGVYFFAMEYVEGETLTDMLRREGVLPMEHGINIIMQIAEALDFAWKNQQLVHRDVKPDNIMLTSRGVAKLADLGLARAASELAEELHQDEVMGTPQYICPEQLLGQPMDTRGDIYSLGATFYQTVTGTFPFDGKSAAEIARKHLQEPLVPPHEIQPDVPEAVSYVICKMMSKKAEDRYNDGAQLANDLSLILRGDVPHGFTGKKPDRQSLRRAPRPLAAVPVAAEEVDEDAEDEDEAFVEEGVEQSSGGGMRLKKKPGKKTKLKLGSKNKKKLRTGTSTNPAPLSADVVEEDEDDDEEAVAVAEDIEQTTQVPGLAGSGRRKKLPLILGGIVVALLLIGGAIAGFMHMRRMAALPTNAQEAEAYYFNVESTKPAEKEAYLELKPYIGKVDEHATDIETLQRVVADSASFIQKFSSSIFRKQADDIDYGDAFGEPDFIAEKIRPHAKVLAGVIPETLTAYEEALVRALRAAQHEQELQEIAARKTSAAGKAAWDQAQAQIEAYVVQRQKEMRGTLNKYASSLKAIEKRLEEEKAELRLAVFQQTMNQNFNEARDIVQKRQLERPGYPPLVETAVAIRLREDEREVAKQQLRKIAQTVDANERNRVDQEMARQLNTSELRTIRQEMEAVPEREKELLALRESWLKELDATLELAERYHGLVAGSGDKLKGERIKVDIPHRPSQELRIGVITSSIIVVNIVEYGTNNQYVTKGTKEWPIANLPIREYMELAKKSWGPQDPNEYNLLLGSYLFYTLYLKEAQTLLENSDSNLAAFMIDQLEPVKNIQLTLRMNQFVQNVKRLVDEGQVAAARKYLQALEQRYGETPEFQQRAEELRTLTGTTEEPVAE